MTTEETTKKPVFKITKKKIIIAVSVLLALFLTDHYSFNFISGGADEPTIEVTVTDTIVEEVLPVTDTVKLPVEVKDTTKK